MNPLGIAHTLNADPAGGPPVRMQTMRSRWKDILRQEIGGARRLLILGVGNPGRGDDAAGLVAASRLKERLPGRRGAGIRIILAGNVPENFSGKIRRFRPTHVLILDSAVGGRRPGTIGVFRSPDVAEDGASTHRVPLSLLARYLEETLGCRILFAGVEPANLAPGEPLSDRAGRAVEALTGYLSGLLRRRGPDRLRSPGRRPAAAKSSSA